jgi:hypothetical protein
VAIVDIVRAIAKPIHASDWQSFYHPASAGVVVAPDIENINTIRKRINYCARIRASKIIRMSTMRVFASPRSGLWMQHAPQQEGHGG